MEELIYKIALTCIPQVGPVTARQLVSYCGGPEQVFSAGRRELMRIPGVGPQIASFILQRRALMEAEAEIRLIEKSGVRPLFYLDEDYPQRLKNYPDCPVMLYYRGNTDLNARRVVAIVGTRRPTVHGVAFCEELMDGLFEYEVVVVSGLAYGIDIAAHRRCLDLGIPTVGVLGHGFNMIYPPQHHSIAQRMVDGGGLLTEYLHHVQPDREHFPMRNRIIAALCDALVVVETGRRGGSMISAEIANAYHKDVFAVPGRVRDRLSEGCNYLIKSHKAALIENAADLAYIMRWDQPRQGGASQGELFPEITEDEKLVVDLLRRAESVHIDQLTFDACMSGSAIAALLLSLEFKGLVKSLPGKRFALLTG